MCDLKIGTETLASTQVNLLPQHKANTQQSFDQGKPTLGQAVATRDAESSQQENPFDSPSNRNSATQQLNTMIAWSHWVPRRLLNRLCFDRQTINAKRQGT